MPTETWKKLHLEIQSLVLRGKNITIILMMLRELLVVKRYILMSMDR